MTSSTQTGPGAVYSSFCAMWRIVPTWAIVAIAAVTIAVSRLVAGHLALDGLERRLVLFSLTLVLFLGQLTVANYAVARGSS